MSALRVGWKVIALATFTPSLVAALVAGKLLLGGSSRPGAAWENAALRTWARVSARILGVRIRVRGTRPEPPFLLVSNHLSYVDVLVYMGVLDARLLSKAEVRHWPMFGWMARQGGTLFVDRTRRRDLTRVIAEIRRALGLHRGVVFFPESTSTAGLDVWPFKPSLFEVAASEEMPVHTATLHYSTPGDQPAAEWTVCWWGEMDFFPHFLEFLKLRRVEAEVHFQEATHRGKDRKQLAAACEAAVREAFRPVSTELGPDPTGRWEQLERP